MGASGMGGGGKSANFELNLVPFIDLMSTLICFLLITSAWQELDVISSQAPPKASAEAPDDPQPRPPDEKKVNLTVYLGADRIEVAEDLNVTTFPHAGDAPDTTKLIETLRRWKTQFPSRTDLTFATDNRARYKHLVLFMDIFNAEKFPDVGINLN